MARYLGIREEVPREICPFCPVIFGSKFPNVFSCKMIQNVHLYEVDILYSGDTLPYFDLRLYGDWLVGLT